MGFSNLESSIYLYLLENSTATGYKIAKDIGKHKTNVYTALGALVEKGALLVDEGDSLLYKAILPNELLGHKENELKSLRTEAEQLTIEYNKEKKDDRIYKLNNITQVYERSSKILKESREVVYIELFPEPFEKLYEEIQKTAKRGVRITVRVYTKNNYQKIKNIYGVRTILSPFGSKTLLSWKLQWLSIFSDGKQHLVAFINTKENTVAHAIWSENTLLSWAFFSYIHIDFLYFSMRPLILEAKSLPDLKKKFIEVENSFQFDKVPGFHLLNIKFNKE